MDNDNWRQPQAGMGGGGGAGGSVGSGAGEQPAADGDDWRQHLPPDSRLRIVKKIMDTLKSHIPFSGQDGMQELEKIAVKFEEKIFHAAVDQADYLRKISLKMLTMENKSQNSVANAMPTSSACNSSRPADPGMQTQLPNQVASMANQMVGNQSQVRQQLLSQSIQNNMSTSGVQGSGPLSSSVPPVSGINQPSMQNMPNISQNLLGNPMGQCLASNMFVNQRQMQGRQQLVSQQQPQQPQNQQQYLYQQQLQNQMLKQKLHQGTIPHTMLSSHMQQPQQPQQQQQPQPNILQTAQIQPSQQSAMLSSAVMQPSEMQVAPLPSLQQNQQPSIQQTSQPMLQQHQQHQQSVMRHQTQPQQAVHQHQASLQQQQMIQSQRQQPNMQQSQTINQQNKGDVQQPQQRMSNQQNNLQNFQQQQPQPHQLMSQQNNLSSLHQHLASHTNVSGMHQQQPVMGAQSSNSIMHVGQHSAHMLQQPKVSAQQQMQSGSPNLMPGQQSQLPLVQQQVMSQMQPHSGQLQQQVGIQQQQASIQRDVQQRVQASGSLLQSPQNVMDQQKQMYQNQRGLAEASTMPLDSAAKGGQANGVEWQEEMYQKMKSLKDAYFQDIKEAYQTIAVKLQQQPKTEQHGRLTGLKGLLESIIASLQLPKSEIHPGLKDKLLFCERQILSLVNPNRPRRLRGQFPTHNMPSAQPQGLRHQVGQDQSHENQVNSQMQSMNGQGSGASMQQNNMNSMQQNSTSSFPGVSNSQQMNSVQSNANLEPGQGNAMSSMQQVTAGSMLQNPVSAPQQVNVSAVTSQGGLSMLQPNINNLQANLNIHQQRHLQLMQQQKQQQLIQQQQFSQVKQQQPSQRLPTQMQTPQLPQLHQMSEMNDVKVRPGMGPNAGLQQHYSAKGQRPAYPHQQLKPGSFPISSPLLLQAVSPQVPQHSSPQVDQQNLLPALANTGTPLQLASSPIVIPTPSTPLAPSPMPADSENQKPASGLSSISNAGNVSHQHANPATAGAHSLAIGTPGISASPLLTEYSGPEGLHGVASSTAVSGKPTVTEHPIERLMRAVKSAPPQALSAVVNDMGSVVTMMDRIAGSAPGNGSRAAIGEDLVAMTKCRMQARNFIMQDVPSGTKRIRRCISAMPLNVASSAGSTTESFKQLMGADTSDLESTASSCVKRSRSKANHALREEIREINQQLIDTVVAITDDDVDPTAVTEVGEGVIVNCYFNAISLSPGLKLQYRSAQLSPIQPLHLFVPSSYPKCSPLVLDKFTVEVSEAYEVLSTKAKSRFSICLRGLSKPMSLKDIARIWDKCSREVILEYAEQSGGGSFSSKYGKWEYIFHTAA